MSDPKQTTIVERSLVFRSPWWNPVRTKVVIHNERGVSFYDLEALARREGWDGRRAVITTLKVVSDE